jgi:hypothetical protein
MFFVPSTAEKVIAVENAPAEQVVVVGADNPVPDKLTVRPVSQVPLTVKLVCATVFTAGNVIAIIGGVVSLIKSRLSEIVIPETPVCEAIIFLKPSPLVKIIGVLKLPFLHIIEFIDDKFRPGPDKSTLTPVVHNPLIVIPFFAIKFCPGEVMQTLCAQFTPKELNASLNLTEFEHPIRN